MTSLIKMFLRMVKVVFGSVVELDFILKDDGQTLVKETIKLEI